MFVKNICIFLPVVLVVSVLGQDEKTWHGKIQNAGKIVQNGPPSADDVKNVIKILSQIDKNTVLKKTIETLLQNGNSNKNSTNAAGILSSLPQVIGLLSKVPNSDEILSNLLKSGISPSVLANATNLLSNVLKLVPQLSKSSGNISNFISKTGSGSTNLPDSTDAILSTILKAVNLPPSLLGPVKTFLQLIEAGNYKDAMSMLSSISKLLNPSSSAGSSKTLTITGVSPTCKLHTQMAINALMHEELWAMKMLDAMGKLPNQLLEGNLKWIGSYDECKAIDANVKDARNQITSPFSGQYCIIGIPFGDIIKGVIGNQEILQGAMANLWLGMCIPDSCNKTDLITAANQVLPKIPLPGNKTLYAVYSNCQKNELEYDTRAIAAFVVCGIFIALMAVATAYDLLFIQWPKNREKSETHHETTQNGSLPNGNGAEVKNGAKFDNEVVVPQKKVQIQPGVPARLLLSFSVYTNARKLLDTTQSPGSITSIHGIRFLSMTWVILGHTYAFISNYAQNAASFSPKIFGRWTFTAILNALISVDTFFALSGLLMSYLILKEMKKKNGAGGINWGLFYFHRFWRLTPPYMLILFVYVATFRYWNDGPIWPQDGTEKNYCKDTWWTNLLYVNNIVKTKEMCFGHAWYLANDMQFYVLSPLLFIPLFYNVFIGVAVCGVFLLTTIITAGVVSSKNNLQPSVLGGGIKGVHHGDYMQDYYFKPWCRMGPYIVGILGGYIMYRLQLKLKINKILNISIWFLAAGVSCAILYGLYGPLKGDNPLNNDVSALYNATHRSVWGAVVCWVVIACATGNGGYVNTLLSWKGFIPLSRLTYCAYLVHPSIIYMTYMSVREPIYLTVWTTVYFFLGHLVVSYGVSFVLSLAFEAPMMGLEKVIFGGRSSKSQTKSSANGGPEVTVISGRNNYFSSHFSGTKSPVSYDFSQESAEMKQRNGQTN